MIQGALGHHRTFVTEKHYLRNRAHPELHKFSDVLDRALAQHPDADGDDAPGTSVVA